MSDSICTEIRPYLGLCTSYNNPEVEAGKKRKDTNPDKVFPTTLRFECRRNTEH